MEQHERVFGNFRRTQGGIVYDDDPNVMLCGMDSTHELFGAAVTDDISELSVGEKFYVRVTYETIKLPDDGGGNAHKLP